MQDLLSRLRDALSDRFDVVEEIGRGGMAIVFRARDLRHPRDVAIKVLEPELSASIGRERFDREIAIAASLQHPHILPLYESGEADGCLYYVMPYAPGQTLRDLLVAKGPLPVEQAVQITCEVADALAYSHDHDIVHRDIKPANILLASGHAVVSDFGVARALHAAGGPDLTATGMALGTPAYMSPEQAAGDQDLDGRSDIYSLACVLYEMLAGDPPFMASTPQALIARQIMESPPSLEVVRPGLPPHLIPALLKALKKVPADRFGSADKFKAALQGAVRVRPERLKSGRKWWILGALGMVAFAALYWFVLRPEPGTLNPDRVVVFPLAESGFRDTGAGVDVAIAIENALVYARPLELASGLDWLGPEVEQGRGVSASSARRIARDLGARFMIDGAVARRSDSVTVRLDLYDLELGLAVREREEGLVSDLGRVGIAAVVKLLPSILDPERSAIADLGPLLDRSPESIALWIQGEREYRSSHFLRALELYDRSLEADSLLAFAAVKGALAASWEQDPESVLRLLDAGLAHDSLLPEPYAYFARGVAAYRRGLPTEALEWLQQARAEDPFWSEPWAIEGEVYFHLLPSAVPLDSLAESFFHEAIRRDSSYTEPLFHLTELAARRGDEAQARFLYDRLQKSGAEPRYDVQLDLMLSCLDDGPSRTDWVPVEGYFEPAFYAGAMFASGAYNPRCARGALEAVLETAADDPGFSAATVFLLQGLGVAEGRPDLSLALLDSAHAAGLRAAEIAYFLDALAGIDVGDRDHVADEGLRAALGDEYERLPRVELLGLLGTWNLYRGSSLRARALADRLAELGDSDPVARIFGQSLQGHLSLANGDTTSAIAVFESLVPPLDSGVLPWTYGSITPLARLKLAELYLARGEFERAYLAATVFDHPEPIHFIPFVRRSLEVRLEAARELDRPDLEERIIGRLDTLAGSESD